MHPHLLERIHLRISSARPPAPHRRGDAGPALASARAVIARTLSCLGCLGAALLLGVTPAAAQITDILTVDEATCETTVLRSFPFEGWGLGTEPTVLGTSEQFLYVANLTDGVIQKVRGDGITSFFVDILPIPPGLVAADLRGVASGGLASGENLWLVDATSGSLYELDTTDGTLLSTVALPATLVEPAGLAAEGDEIFVVDAGVSPTAIHSFDVSTGLPLPGIPTPYADAAVPAATGLASARVSDGLGGEEIVFSLIEATAPSTKRTLDPDASFAQIDACDLGSDDFRGLAAGPDQGGPAQVQYAVRYSDVPFVDTDNDGIADPSDVCSEVADGPVSGTCNGSDADGDGFGDACDADYDNDNIVAGSDWALLVNALGTADPVYDSDCDGLVGGSDFAFVLMQFGNAPGPGAVTGP